MYGPVLTTVVRFANEKRHNVMLILVALETTHAQNPAVKDIRPTTSSLNSEISFCLLILADAASIVPAFGESSSVAALRVVSPTLSKTRKGDGQPQLE